MLDLIELLRYQYTVYLYSIQVNYKFCCFFTVYIHSSHYTPFSCFEGLQNSIGAMFCGKRPTTP